MIGFRYHVVSIVAVFLALTLGILLGSSVIQGAVVDQLRRDITRYRTERDAAREDMQEIRTEQQRLREVLTGGVVPWALSGRLTGTPVVIVTDGLESPAWREHVTDGLVRAGATIAGTIAIGPRFDLVERQDAADLADAVEASGLAFEPGDDAASAALSLLGERLLDPSGRVLLGELDAEGFVTATRDAEGAWPPPSSLVVVLSPAGGEEDEPTGGVAAFVSSVGNTTATLAATDDGDGPSVVTQLRDRSGDLPRTISTFAGATDADDPGGVGVVAALLAATEGRGGHFGSGGDSFIAPPVAQE